VVKYCEDTRPGHQSEASRFKVPRLYLLYTFYVAAQHTNRTTDRQLEPAAAPPT